jgi:hypothetical protein
MLNAACKMIRAVIVCRRERDAKMYKIRLQVMARARIGRAPNNRGKAYKITARQRKTRKATTTTTTTTTSRRWSSFRPHRASGSRLPSTVHRPRTVHSSGRGFGTVLQSTAPPPMTDSTSSDPHIPPFRGRQAIYHRPGPRFNARAVKFHALRMRLPLRTSHAACARYRLGQKNTIPLSPKRDIATADRLDIQLNTIYTRLLLLDTILATHVVPPPAVIRAPSHASSSRCDPAPSAHSRDVPPRTPSRQHRPTPPSSPYAPPPPTSAFFGG